MGGCDFETMSAGRDAKEAFSNAVERAIYDRGHEGYSGTIKEKAGFYAIALPPRVSVKQAVAWTSDWSGVDSVPKAHRAWVGHAINIFNDKWGPAVCFELRGAELKAAKERMGLKGTRKKVFVFCGIASS